MAEVPDDNVLHDTKDHDVTGNDVTPSPGEHSAGLLATRKAGEAVNPTSTAETENTSQTHSEDYDEKTQHNSRDDGFGKTQDISLLKCQSASPADMSSIDVNQEKEPDISTQNERKADVTNDVTSSSDACDDDSRHPDFSLLPELVWVSVFQLLSLADRYRLSQVNWFFNTLFHDGTVWRTASITFAKALVHGYFYMARYKLTLLEVDKKLARKFGHLYRDVTLRVRGRPEEMEDDTRQIMTHLLQSWRLENLTLDIGDREWGNRYQGVESIDGSLLTTILSVLRESASLKRLHVLHWPQSYLINEEHLQLNEVLSAADCQKLTSLRLPRTSENGLRTLSSPADLAVHVVTKFRCLRHLYVTSDMLSDALFSAIVASRDVRLKSMAVEVNGFWSTGLLEHLLLYLPWSTLTSHDPNLVVAMTISADVPEFALERFLAPDIPLVAITFDINSHCYRKAFQLMHQYCLSLRSFRCLSDAQDCELEVLDMVKVCSKLQHLHYHGHISDYNVLKLAECGGRRWGDFSFVWRNIEKTRVRPTPFNLVSTASGHHHDDDLGPVRTEEEVKDEFCRQVSTRLGFPWKPIML